MDKRYNNHEYYQIILNDFKLQNRSKKKQVTVKCCEKNMLVSTLNNNMGIYIYIFTLYRI